MYTQETRVAVYPFTRQAEGGEIVIGRTDTGVFLALPPDAVEILDILARGETVGRAQEIYREKYGETPEMEEFLGFLQSKGLVKPRKVAGPPPGGAGDQAVDPTADRAAERADDNRDPAAPREVRYHFTNIPQPVAQALFGRTALTLVALLAALAAAAVFRAPSIFPGRGALFFHHDKTLMTLCLVLMGYTTVFLHEMGHLVAARSRGVSSRLGISRRMWILVAETDMTGLWSVPKEQRYLPVLAGPLVDVTSASAMLLVLFAHHQHWITLLKPVFELMRAMCFVYMMRLLWQCFFFVRTDFYYVIASFFGCKSLMRDTQVYIQNRYRRLVSSPKPLYDQSHIPEPERRVIRAYAWVWLLGRTIALCSLFLITLPVTFRYLLTSSKAIIAGFSGGHYAFFDALFIFFFNLLPITLGLTWWIGSLLKRWRLDGEKRAYAT